MKKLEKGDYIVRFSQVRDALNKALVGKMMFNEDLNRVEKIGKVNYTRRKNNLGTLFNPVYEEVTIVEGVQVVSETHSNYGGGSVVFPPNKGVEWIENIIPRRMALLSNILSQFKFMNK